MNFTDMSDFNVTAAFGISDPLALGPSAAVVASPDPSSLGDCIVSSYYISLGVVSICSDFVD